MKRITLVACLALAALAARAEDPPLTLGEALRRAVERSTLVAAQDAAIDASRHMAVSARQLPDPVLKVGVQNVPVSGADRFTAGGDFMTMRQVGVTQEITREGKRELRAERYRLEARKSQAERRDVIATLQRNAALAWIDGYYATAVSRLVDEQAAAARLEAEGAEAAYRAGRGAEADVFAARGALAALEDRAAEAHRREATARIGLARWIGPRADAPLAGPPPIEAVGDRHHESHIESHPMIEALARQEDIASTEARLAQANATPDWSVELMYSVRGSAFSDMVSVGLSVPLPWDRANRQDQEVAAKLALASQVRALREDAVRAHAAEIQAARTEWESDRERLARYEKELVPLAQERAAATLAGYRGGRASLAETLAARRNEMEVRTQAVQLEREAARAWAQLDFLVPDESSLPPGLDLGGGEGLR
jgi:outer membrane protein TolC